MRHLKPLRSSRTSSSLNSDCLDYVSTYSVVAEQHSLRLSKARRYEYDVVSEARMCCYRPPTFTPMPSLSGLAQYFPEFSIMMLQTVRDMDFRISSFVATSWPNSLYRTTNLPEALVTSLNNANNCPHIVALFYRPVTELFSTILSQNNADDKKGC